MAIQFLITAPASLLLLKFAAAKCIYTVIALKSLIKTIDIDV